MYHEGHTSVVKLLLENKADVNAQNENGYTALMFASTRNHIGTVLEIVKADTDLG